METGAVGGIPRNSQNHGSSIEIAAAALSRPTHGNLPLSYVVPAAPKLSREIAMLLMSTGTRAGPAEDRRRTPSPITRPACFPLARPGDVHSA